MNDSIFLTHMKFSSIPIIAFILPMDHLAKQTYLYLAFQAAIIELGLQHRREKLGSILSQIIQEKLKEAINGAHSKSTILPKNSKNVLEATMVLDSEFPCEKGDHQKLQAVLYDMSSILNNSTAQLHRNDIALLQLFSASKTSKGKGKEAPSKKETAKPKCQNGDMTDLDERDELDACKRPNDHKLKSKANKKSKAQ